MPSKKRKSQYGEETQVEYYKRIGVYGSAKDPQWNVKEQRHDCCGATRAFYHKKSCPLCQDIDD